MLWEVLDNGNNHKSTCPEIQQTGIDGATLPARHIRPSGNRFLRRALVLYVS